MNIKNFVTYQQALDLKKLGFTEECLYYYDNSKTLHSNYVSGLDFAEIDDLLTSNNLYYPNLEYIDAPTIFQAQNWLRDVKSIDVHYHYGKKHGKWTYFYGEEWRQPSYQEEFDSPIEALSAGITACLIFLLNHQ